MLPSRSRLAAVPVLALLALACQDRAGPLSPDRASPRASVVAGVCDAAADARAHEIVNLLYPPTERDTPHQQFNAGRQHAEAGRLAEAWAVYTVLLDDVLARAADAPEGSPAPALARELAALILVCSRQPAADPALLALLGLSDADLALRDVTLAVVSPTEPFSVVTPKRHFGVSGPAGFFDAPALLIISRLPDGAEFVTDPPGQFEQVPPRFNVTVIPYDAQANFDDVVDPGYGPEDVLDTGVESDVAICPAFDHGGDDDDFRVLRRPEAFLNEPTALLPASTPAIVSTLSCADAGQTPYAAAGTSPTDRLFAGLRRAGTHVGGLLLPRLAHAVDGGIGGRTRLYSDYVSARPILPSGRDALVDRVLFRVNGQLVSHLPLAPNPIEAVQAVPQQAYGASYVDLTTGVTCSWSSNKPNDVTVVQTGPTTATATRTPGYTGAAKVTAVCNGTAGSLQILPGVAQGG